MLALDCPLGFDIPGELIPLTDLPRTWPSLFSHPVMFDSLRLHGPKHVRLPCSSLSPSVGPSSCPWHLWCHPAISSSDALFSFCPKSFRESGTFPMSQLFTLDDQITGVSTSVSILSMSIQSLFPLRFTGLISLLSKELIGIFYSITVWRHQFFGAPPSLRSSSHSCM